MNDCDASSVRDSISPLCKIQSTLNYNLKIKVKVHPPAYGPHCNTINQLPHREPLCHPPSSNIPLFTKTEEVTVMKIR